MGQARRTAPEEGQEAEEVGRKEKPRFVAGAEVLLERSEEEYAESLWRSKIFRPFTNKAGNFVRHGCQEVLFQPQEEWPQEY